MIEIIIQNGTYKPIIHKSDSIIESNDLFIELIECIHWILKYTRNTDHIKISFLEYKDMEPIIHDHVKTMMHKLTDHINLVKLNF